MPVNPWPKLGEDSRVPYPEAVNTSQIKSVTAVADQRSLTEKAAALMGIRIAPRAGRDFPATQIGYGANGYFIYRKMEETLFGIQPIMSFPLANLTAATAVETLEKARREADSLMSNACSSFEVPANHHLYPSSNLSMGPKRDFERVAIIDSPSDIIGLSTAPGFTFIHLRDGKHPSEYEAGIRTELPFENVVAKMKAAGAQFIDLR